MAAAVLLACGGVSVVKEFQRIPPTQFVESQNDLLQNADADIRARANTQAIALFEAMSDSAQNAGSLRRWASVAVRIAQDAALTGDAETSRARAAQAARLARAAIRRDPLHPLGWTYLAHASRLETGNGQAAARYLLISYEMAPIEPTFAPYRLLLATGLQKHLSIRLFRAMRRDLRGILNTGRWGAPWEAFRHLASGAPVILAIGDLLVRGDETMQDPWQSLKKGIEQ